MIRIRHGCNNSIKILPATMKNHFPYQIFINIIKIKFQPNLLQKSDLLTYFIYLPTYNKLKI